MKYRNIYIYIYIYISFKNALFKKCYFLQAVLNVMVSRKIIDAYYHIAQKHRNITVKDLRKYKKLRHRKNKLK